MKKRIKMYSDKDFIVSQCATVDVISIIPVGDCQCKLVR